MLLQIDGLSTRRFLEALARGEMPHLARRLARGEVRLRKLTAATAPSTPVFQAGLLYGHHGDVPGFGWFDRTLGHAVRMDLAEDVLAVAETLAARGRPLLEAGVSYGTIWPAGAAHAYFNVVSPVHGASARGRTAQNAYDRLVAALAGVGIAGRVAGRLALELGIGVWDFVRWCRRIRTTRFEWRFLYMRLIVAVVMREVATAGAIVDVLRGVPLIYLDYLGYDEYAHRRGPDSPVALYNLRGIDQAIARVVHATQAVREYGYDVYVFSDHGQSKSTPFELVMGRDLHRLVLENATRSPVGKPIETSAIHELVTLRENEQFVRTLWRPLRRPLALYLGWLERRLERRLDGVDRESLAIRVVTGGSIAHLYFPTHGRAAALDVDTIARRWPALFKALVCCPAVGLVVGQSAAGPVVFYRGRKYRLADRKRVARLAPFFRLGYDLLARHLEAAAKSARSGDLVLYGAFAERGNITFDFEFGTHGGVGPEELDHFMIHPAAIDPPLAGAVTPEDFYRFFHGRYGVSCGCAS